jgi:hypothetical protein
MNMGVTLAVYATICRETGRPFCFPGSAMQWNGLTDMTDAGLLARHLEWAVTTEAAHNQAFNVVNGDIFRWSWMWPRLAQWFGIAAAPFTGDASPLERQSGETLLESTALPSTILAGLHPPGTPMPTWDVRSRLSRTLAKAANWAF